MAFGCAVSQGIFEAIYALHEHDWLDPADGMGEAALYLADLLCQLMPDVAEVLGLSAVIALGQARAQARVRGGVLVPPDEQDTSLWDDRLIAYGKCHLMRAHRQSRIGRFQIEAAIQAVHIDRKESGLTDWNALAQLYHAYLQIAPSAGALVAQAAVTAQVHGHQSGLDMLATLEGAVGAGFRPLWAVRADIYARTGQGDRAVQCYDRAKRLSTDVPVIRFLRKKQESVRSRA